MNKPITPSTYVRTLSHGVIRNLADFLDPQEGWKQVAVHITKPTGEPRYDQLRLRRFEGLIQRGKSPTSELLFDWGTTNCTVSDLVDILIKTNFLAPASLLLPDAVPVSKLPLQHIGKPTSSPEIKPSFPNYTTRKVGASQLIPLQKANESAGRPGVRPPTPDSTSEEDDGPCLNDTGFYMFSYQHLMKITGNFNEHPVATGGNKLGEGGFGVVFKGCFNSRLVAVKRLAALPLFSLQELKIQFDQEIETMANCRHENLVEMIGFSNDSDHPCLVYDYMPNGSLMDRLACLDNTPPLSWYSRCKIAQGTARGLLYLHSNHHIHRDVKSANILLNDNFVPKISDFGLARASGQFTHTVMTERIVGTTAYMAPEALRGEVTPKSDIFSFGVVLLEIITGLLPSDENQKPPSLLDIKEDIEDDEMTIEDYVDKKLGTWDSESIEQMYSIASQCLHDNKKKRPTVEKVQQMLENLTSHS
ncbi:interleukin-1 receptor-associated kinase 4 [Protopterus annectens]|uniref:interleukin-1 receptor-associated kinase 4 n=1 Tax=Protopterus annectens TaxID=7888 RepID=UPI001CFA0FE0|nr:interleukin-1 receptor-associated kinase 4 [Protopterus annectens]